VARKVPHFGVKEAVFPFPMFPEVDPLLGPEMRSTGEVLGMANSFGLAFYKAQEATKSMLPEQGTVLLTINERDRKPVLVEIAKGFAKLGFRLLATSGTAAFLAERGVECQTIAKTGENRPDIVDEIKNGNIQLVINTPIGRQGKSDDSHIRKSAIRYRVPYITTLAAAKAAVQGIAAYVDNTKGTGVRSLQEYHAALD